jgi:hypothetical protein
LYINENDGIYTAIPMDGKIIDIVDPEMGDGTLVKTGAVEMLCAPIFYNPKALAICGVKLVASTGGGDDNGGDGNGGDGNGGDGNGGDGNGGDGNGGDGNSGEDD